MLFTFMMYSVTAQDFLAKDLAVAISFKQTSSLSKRHSGSKL